MPTANSASGPGGAQASITVETHDDRTTAMTQAVPKQFLTKVVNRTGFLGDLIAWEDGVYGTSKSVFSGGA